MTVLNRTLSNQETIIEKIEDIEKNAIRAYAQLETVSTTIDKIVNVLHGNGKAGILDRMSTVENIILGIHDKEKTELEYKHDRDLMKAKIVIGAILSVLGFALGVGVQYLVNM